MSLCLWGKLNVIKMNIVPYLIYVLRGIPMSISNKYFIWIDYIQI